MIYIYIYIILVGCFKHFLIFHNIWDSPSHWLYFSRWLKPPTSISLNISDFPNFNQWFTMDIHGTVPRFAAPLALQGFRNGEIQLLVTTDVMGRGLDIPGISHVPWRRKDGDFTRKQPILPLKVGKSGLMGWFPMPRMSKIICGEKHFGRSVDCPNFPNVICRQVGSGVIGIMNTIDIMVERQRYVWNKVMRFYDVGRFMNK